MADKKKFRKVAPAKAPNHKRWYPAIGYPDAETRTIEYLGVVAFPHQNCVLFQVHRRENAEEAVAIDEAQVALVEKQLREYRVARGGEQHVSLVERDKTGTKAHMMRIRVTPAEHHEVTSFANARGLTVSDAVMKAALAYIRGDDG